jgi:hypothetical protein
MRRVLRIIAACVLAASAAAAPAAPDPAPAPAAPPPPAVFALGPGEELTLALPALEEFTAHGPKGKQRKGAWEGKAGRSNVWIELRTYERVPMGFHEPEDVTERVAESYADPDDDGDDEFKFTTQELLKGAFGAAPYASLCAGDAPRRKGETGSSGELLVLGAVMDRYAYSIRVFLRPRASDADRARLRDFLLKGVTAKCPARNVKWTDEEVAERWKWAVKDPKVAEQLKDITRTKHYIVFTNSSAGSLFAKKMEECYAAVKKVFPFPEVEGRRLMPVFVFRMPEEYYQFCVDAAGWSMAKARRSKGHAKGDYYATYYESPNDPVHVHEATHQIFKNLLRLSGGGSWLQEGLAEYMSTSHNERKAFARRATRDGAYIPFTKFVQISSLLNADGVDADAAYAQAASLVDFLRDGDFKPELFPKFVAEVGALPRGNLVRIQQAVQRLYGTDLAGVEKEWVEYWKK